MKSNAKPFRRPRTLGDLVNTVQRFTQNERLSALIVADMINARRVRLHGVFHGKTVVVR